MSTIVASAAGGNWSIGATWTGGIAPTSADDVQLNAGSGPITIDVAAFCRSLDCTGYTGTLTHGSAIQLKIGTSTPGLSNIALLFSAGMTYTPSSASSEFIFVSTSTTVQSVSFNSKQMRLVTFNGLSGSWQLTTPLNTATGSTVSLIAGTLDTNGQTCSWGFFAGTGAAIRTLSLGASNITLTGAAGTHWNMTTTTGLTFNAGTSNITFSYTSTCTFNGGNLTYNNVTFNYLMGISLNITGTNTFANLTFTGGVVTNTNQAEPNFTGNTTVTGTLTMTGSSPATRIGPRSSVDGTPRTITAAAVSLTNVDFRDITAAGAAIPFTGTSIGDAGGNSNITFTAPVTRYAVAAGNWSSTATWSATSGGASGASVPLPQDSVFINASSGVGTIATNMFYMCTDLDFTGYTGTLGASVVRNSFGSLILSSTMTVSASSGWTFRGRGSHTITSNGKAHVGARTFAGPGSTYTLADDFTMSVITDTLGVSNGTFDAGGKNVSVGLFSSTNTNTRTINMGSGTWTLNGTGTVWNFGTDTNCTLNPGTSTAVVSDTSATAKTITMGSATATLYNLTITGGGTGSVTLGGSTTRIFNNVTIGAPKTVLLTAGATRQVNGTFTAVGTLGNLISINSTTPGSQATLSKASGTVSADYLSLQDSAATGGATWYAGANSTNVSNNTGWIFTAPSGGSYLLLMGIG